jgi:hypothetical protein
VDWKGLGLADYPQIVKQPMDLSTVMKRLTSNSYSSIDKAADDVRLIWKNCMAYNADGE